MTINTPSSTESTRVQTERIRTYGQAGY